MNAERLRRPNFHALRDRAESVPCPWCEAQQAEHCSNPATGAELSAPAHFQRIDAARAARAAFATPTDKGAVSDD